MKLLDLMSEVEQTRTLYCILPLKMYIHQCKEHLEFYLGRIKK